VDHLSVSGREIDFAAGAYGFVPRPPWSTSRRVSPITCGQGHRANTVSPGNTYFAGGVWSQIENGDPELFKWRSVSTDGGMGHTAGDGHASRSSPAPASHQPREPRRRACPDEGVQL